MTLAGFDLPTAQTLFNSRGHYDTINVLAAPGRRQRHAAARDRAGCCRPASRSSAARPSPTSCRARSTTSSSFISTALLIFAVDRAVRRRLHDLQHVLDHGRPAHPRARAAARRRREPPAGVPLGARRGRADRARRLADRPRARRARRARPQGAAEGVRHRRCRRRRWCSRRARRWSRSRVGVGVTVISAIVPARRAVRIPPVAALVEHSEDEAESLRRRRVIGGVAVAVARRARRGRAGWPSRRSRWSASARSLVFIAVGMLVPVARAAAVERARTPARRAARHARPARARELDAQPAPHRADRRRADDRARARLDDRRARRVAEHVGEATASTARSAPTTSSPARAAFSKSVAPTVVAPARASTTTTTIYQGQFEFEGSLSTLVAATPGAPRRRRSRCTSPPGSGAPAMAAGELLVDTDTASADHLHVGSVVPVKFAQTGAATMRDRRDLQAEPARRQLRRRRRRSSSPTSTTRSRSASCSARRPARPISRPALNRALDAVRRTSAIQTRAQFEQSQQNSDQPAARAGLRAARAGGRWSR